MMSIIPVSATKSTMRYEFYRNNKVPQEAFQGEVDFFKQVEAEDKWLSNNAQLNLNSDTYVAGPLHPYMERAVKYFEDLLRPLLYEHVAEEKKSGKEYWPARRAEDPQKGASDDELFCQSLCDKSLAGKEIAW
jgi:Ring hydroxylating alpha subunit (catalytic domain)